MKIPHRQRSHYSVTSSQASCTARTPEVAQWA